MRPCTQVHIVRPRSIVPFYLLLKLLKLVGFNEHLLLIDESAQLTVSVYDDESDEQSLIHASQVAIEQSVNCPLDKTTGLRQTSVIMSAQQQYGEKILNTIGHVPYAGLVIEEKTLNAIDYAPYDWLMYMNLEFSL